MNVWTNEHKKLWALLVLGGATIEKRKSRRHNAVYTVVSWYLTLPLPSYLNGPFTSKGAAVLYAAEEMGVPECLIQPVRNVITKPSLSASLAAAWSSLETSRVKPGDKSRALLKPQSRTQPS